MGLWARHVIQWNWAAGYKSNIFRTSCFDWLSNYGYVNRSMLALSKVMDHKSALCSHCRPTSYNSQLTSVSITLNTELYFIKYRGLTYPGICVSEIECMNRNCHVCADSSKMSQMSWARCALPRRLLWQTGICGAHHYSVCQGGWRSVKDSIVRHIRVAHINLHCNLVC